jgi:hypothetical protein
LVAGTPLEAAPAGRNQDCRKRGDGIRYTLERLCKIHAHCCLVKRALRQARQIKREYAEEAYRAHSTKRSFQCTFTAGRRPAAAREKPRLLRGKGIVPPRGAKSIGPCG